MKVSFLIVGLGVALALGLSFRPGRAVEPALVDVWQLKQESANFGKLTVYIGADRARVDFYAGGSHIVARAPDWKAVIWNDEGAGITLSSKTWQTTELDLLAIYAKDIYAKVGGKSARTVRYLGHKALALEQVNAENGRAAILQSDVGTQKRFINGVTRAICTRELELSEGAAGFCCGLYSTPQMAPVLLSSGTSEDTGQFWCFRTTAVEKKKVPASLFVAPTKFKAVSRIQQVLVGARGTNVLLDVLGTDAAK